MQELNKRNTETVEQALKDMYKKIESQEIRINQLNTGMSAMTERFISLEKQLLIERMRHQSHGASVK